MGSAPRWWRILQAARYLNTTPWDLEERGWRYVLQAEEARYSENYAASKAAAKNPGTM